jgi:fatty-acyl-CoA synthase
MNSNRHEPGKSYHHRGGTEPLLGLTIAEHLADVIRDNGNNEAVVSIPQQRRLTYCQLARQADQLARGLLGLGFTSGERIGIWSTNNIEWLLLQIATARIGVVLVNINPAYRPEELSYALLRSEIQGLFLIPSFRSSDYVKMLVELVPEIKTNSPEMINSESFPLLKRVVLYNPSDPPATRLPYKGFTVWKDVIDAAESVSSGQLERATRGLDIDDPVNIQYTSGTTGSPKAVVLTHHNILNNAWFAGRSMDFGADDRLVVAVPFYHCFGMVLANLLCLCAGGCLVIPCEHFDAFAVLEAIDTEKCTTIHGVPTMFIAQLEHPRFGDFDLSSLRTGIMAGAPCPPALLERVMSDMHCREILIGYGETEASPLTHLTHRNDSVERRINSVGRNLEHQEVKVVDVQDRNTLALGQAGEICFRGYHIMQGYYGDDEATRRAIDVHGWLASGDIGIMDAEGYLQITGRLKEMIIRAGENIYPREIEDLLYAHPAVSEAAVFGVPDEYYGEEIMAWIQPLESISEEEIRTFLKDRIAHFKVPKYIHFVDEFPMTVTGKLQKFRMREIAMQSMT